jgi:molybdopterin-binding protein
MKMMFNYDIRRLDDMKISARNVLKGKVAKVTHGAVNSEVVVQLPGRVEIISIITKKSAKALMLSKGKQVYAIIKASNVMIATD